MSNHVYLAFFRKEVGGGYLVTFPDVPGAISEGDDFSDALTNAKEALESYLDSLVADGERLPPSRSLNAVVSEADGAIVAAIEAETESKTVRVNVSFDERLLARIDRAAEESGRTRSGFLARAAREWLSGRRAGNAGLRVVSQQGDARSFYEQAHSAFEKNVVSSSELTAAIEDLHQRLRASADGFATFGHTTSSKSPFTFGSGSEHFGPFAETKSLSERSGGLAYASYCVALDDDEDVEDADAVVWAELAG